MIRKYWGIMVLLSLGIGYFVLPEAFAGNGKKVCQPEDVQTAQLPPKSSSQQKFDVCIPIETVEGEEPYPLLREFDVSFVTVTGSMDRRERSPEMCKTFYSKLQTGKTKLGFKVPLSFFRMSIPFLDHCKEPQIIEAKDSKNNLFSSELYTSLFQNIDLNLSTTPFVAGKLRILRVNSLELKSNDEELIIKWKGNKHVVKYTVEVLKLFPQEDLIRNILTCQRTDTELHIPRTSFARALALYCESYYKSAWPGRASFGYDRAKKTSTLIDCYIVVNIRVTGRDDNGKIVYVAEKADYRYKIRDMNEYKSITNQAG